MNWLSGIYHWFNRGVDTVIGDGLAFFRRFDPRAQFNDYTAESAKIRAVLTNPAVLKVFSLQCDLFSLGEVYVYKKDKLIVDDPALDLLNNPNPLQTRSQYLWDYMFWNMIGTAYGYVDSKVISEDNKLYFLDVSKMEFPKELEKLKDKLILSKKTITELAKINIKYKYEDGTSIQIPMDKIICLSDLTNGIGNWFKSPSRIDALYKIISNSEATLDADNINIRFSGKFIVSGQADPENVSQLPMAEDEKQDIETKINGRKQVHATKTMIEIKRFVESLKNHELGKKYLEAYFLIGSMYGIPRDVLEAYNSSTYENQEKARASHVSYTLQPKGNDLMNALSKRFGYDQKGKKIVIDWAHLPFMQVFEKDRAQTQEIKARTFSNLLNAGVDLEEVNGYLDTDFKTGKAKENGKAKAAPAEAGN